MSYFDNGEEYGNDDDDADEGPVYWRIYRAKGISINTFCKKTERCTRKLTYYSSKKGTSQVSAKEKTLQSLSNPNKGENFRYIISLRGLNGSHGG